MVRQKTRVQESVKNHKQKCNFCGADAEYDFKTVFGGRWAFGCQECFDRHNLAGVGIGKGSKLYGKGKIMEGHRDDIR